MRRATTGVGLLHMIWGDRPETFQRELSLYMRALLGAAVGDGQISPPERRWVVDYAQSFGLESDAVEALVSEPAPEDFAELVLQLHPGALPDELTAIARALVFDAMRACSADGDYADAERARVHRLIGQFGITQQDVEEMEDIFLGD